MTRPPERPTIPPANPGFTVHNHEIVEQGIGWITFMMSDFLEEEFLPDDGIVKWFVDELGSKWVKFRQCYEDGSREDLVIPHERVLCVGYPKD